MNAHQPLILIVEDERRMRAFLRTLLEGQGYRTVEADTGAGALAAAASHAPDVILLDLGLPDIDGLEVTKRLREWTLTPIIVLSARERDDDKVSALDAGADDYLTKPFSSNELQARIRVALRNAVRGEASEPELTFQVGELRVDLVQRTVHVGGVPVHLTPIEYNLLALLVRYAGRVLTHQQILKAVWGPACAQRTTYVRVYMTHLRRKIERDPARPRYLITELGVGYRLLAELPR